MEAIVRALAAVARRAPAAVVVVLVLATVGFGVLASGAQVDQSQEAFSPDNPRLRAAEFANDAFEGGAAQTVVQVLVEGDDVVSPDGLATVEAVTAAVLATVPPDQLGGDGQPVVSHLSPVQAALGSGQLAPDALSDPAGFDRAWAQAAEQAPPELAQLARGLVAGGGDDPAVGADAALVLVQLDTAAIVGDADDDTVALERQVDAVSSCTSTSAAAATSPLASCASSGGACSAACAQARSNPAGSDSASGAS